MRKAQGDINQRGGPGQMNFTEEALKQALMQADDDWNEQIDMPLPIEQ